MPDIYHQISNKLDNTARPAEEIKKLKIDPGAWSLTPGGKVMAALGTAPTLDDLFAAFTSHGRKSAWVWNPGIVGARKGDLLDGTVSAGECALFAANLRLLAIAPPPYGLGLDAKDIEYWAFYGKHAQGFVARHDHATIMSPVLANVRRPDLVQSPTRYYLWPNHKVLVHKGRVYDPSYGTVSDKRPYLGILQVKLSREWSKRPDSAPPEWQPTAREGRAEFSIDGSSYVLAGDDELRDYLFRKVQDTERPDEPFQGPYELTDGGEVAPCQLG